MAREESECQNRKIILSCILGWLVIFIVIALVLISYLYTKFKLTVGPI